MADLQELANDYFDRHPSNNECFITSDGRVFHQNGAAAGYATALKDDEVKKFERTPAVAEPTEEEEEDDNANVLTLATFNAETADYKEALALAKSLELTLASNKKDDVFAALLEAQKNIEPLNN